MRLDITDLYNQHVLTVAKNFIKVTLTDADLDKITKFVDGLVVEKRRETRHLRDGISEKLRFIDGLKGERALEYLLGIEIIDWSMGESALYNVPDIPGYQVGIKTVGYGKFPVIPTENTYSQIICICHPSNPYLVYVCGLAEPVILNKFQNDDLLLDPNLKAKGTKTGFYGFRYLIKVDKLDDLKPYIGNIIRKEDTNDGGSKETSTSPEESI